MASVFSALGGRPCWEGVKGISRSFIEEFGGREDLNLCMLSEVLTMVMLRLSLFSNCRASARKGMMCPWAMNGNSTTSSFSSAISLFLWEWL